MGKEENILRKVGTKNPFWVPDHYFEEVTQEIMSKLPEKEPMLTMSEPTMWERVKPWLYMAAMFCGLMLSVRMFVGEKEAQSPAAGTMGDMEFSEVPDEYIDPIVDQTMMDDYTLYEYLTDADTEIYK